MPWLYPEHGTMILAITEASGVGGPAKILRKEGGVVRKHSTSKAK